MKPYKIQEDFRKNNLNAGCENLYDIGYKLFVFDMGSQNILSSARPINVIFKLHKKAPTSLVGFALIITNKLISTSKGGQKQLNAMYIPKH